MRMIKYELPEGAMPYPQLNGLYQITVAERDRLRQQVEELPWQVFDQSGKLRAAFESESEAYFYIRNRGHVNGGSYKHINDARAALNNTKG